ncbi:MAG: S16 family serine protease [Chloroflexota bacterium]
MSRAARRPLVHVALALVLAAACLPAGAAAQDAPPSGVLRPVDGGTEITVPALWAGRKSDGTPVGGMEAAEVRAVRTGDTFFRVDLSAAEADGGGPSWLAASASAAFVSTLYSGGDPAEIDLFFDITGPIDGPSAGAVLTIGALAAQLGVPLRPGVTMTGTISPDGSVGPVGGVPTKIESAAAAGFTTVLIPAANRMGYPADAQDPVDLVPWGAERGVTVIPVTDLATAWQVFTGTDLVPAVRGPYVPSASVEIAGRHTAGRLLRRVETLRAAWPADLPLPEPAIDAEIADIHAALAARDFPLAYGLGVDALIRLARADGRRQVDAWIAEGGTARAVEGLATWLGSLDARAEEQTAFYADVTGLGLAQQVSVPAALGWVTYAQAVAEGLLPVLPTFTDAETLGEIGAIAGEQAVSIDSIFPDTIVSIVAMDEEPYRDPALTVPFLAAYTQFLVAAGDANMGYVEDVFGYPLTPENLAGRTAALERAAVALADRTDAEPTPGATLTDEVARAARAMSYFVISSTLVSGAQAYGLDGFGIGEDPGEAQTRESFRASLANARSTVAAYSGALVDAGIDPGYSAWSAQWGTSVADALAGTPREAAGAVLALNELWYDAITVLMLHAVATD